MNVSPQFKRRLRQILTVYHTHPYFSSYKDELAFIKKTVSFFRNSFVGHGRFSVRTRSRSIDKTSIVEFVHNTPNKNPAHTEIGDILFVSKFMKNGQLVEKRALIVQAKFSSNPKKLWNGIDTSQFSLIHDWPPFLRIKPEPQKPYHLKPKSLTWGTYAFVGPNALNYPIYYSASRISNQTPHLFSQKTFTFSPPQLYGVDTSPCFLMRFILCRIGENLLNNGKINLFVDELYRLVGLKPDPPDEFYWDSPDKEEISRGFSVIEFTVSMEGE